MLIVIDKILDEIKQGRMNIYDPRNIILSDYDPARLDKLKVQLGSPLSPAEYRECMYCPPELIRGELPTEKSLVYNIGLIWDELLHGERYYNSV
jgi:hypothetical protein